MPIREEDLPQVLEVTRGLANHAFDLYIRSHKTPTVEWEREARGVLREAREWADLLSGQGIESTIDELRRAVELLTEEAKHRIVVTCSISP